MEKFDFENNEQFQELLKLIKSSTDANSPEVESIFEQAKYYFYKR